MSWPIQDHANALLALLAADAQLTVYDGAVPDSPAAQYALVYFYVETPDGLTAPDKVPLTFNSDVITAHVYVHCVGGNAVAARAISGRVRSLLQNVTLTIASRSCFPIRWVEGSPPQRDESTGPLVMDLVDVYGWTSVPG